MVSNFFATSYFVNNARMWDLQETAKLKHISTKKIRKLEVGTLYISCYTFISMDFLLKFFFYTHYQEYECSPSPKASIYVFAPAIITRLVYGSNSVALVNNKKKCSILNKLAYWKFNSSYFDVSWMELGD